jgi:hypothetical protein
VVIEFPVMSITRTAAVRLEVQLGHHAGDVAVEDQLGRAQRRVVRRLGDERVLHPRLVTLRRVDHLGHREPLVLVLLLRLVREDERLEPEVAVAGALDVAVVVVPHEQSLRAGAQLDLADVAHVPPRRGAHLADVGGAGVGLELHGRDRRALELVSPQLEEHEERSVERVGQRETDVAVAREHRGAAFLRVVLVAEPDEDLPIPRLLVDAEPVVRAGRGALLLRRLVRPVHRLHRRAGDGAVVRPRHEPHAVGAGLEVRRVDPEPRRAGTLGGNGAAVHLEGDHRSGCPLHVVPPAPSLDLREAGQHGILERPHEGDAQRHRRHAERVVDLERHAGAGAVPDVHHGHGAAGHHLVAAHLVVEAHAESVEAAGEVGGGFVAGAGVEPRDLEGVDVQVAVRPAPDEVVVDEVRRDHVRARLQRERHADREPVPLLAEQAAVRGRGLGAVDDHADRREHALGARAACDEDELVPARRLDGDGEADRGLGPVVAEVHAAGGVAVAPDVEASVAEAVGPIDVVASFGLALGERAGARADHAHRHRRAGVRSRHRRQLERALRQLVGVELEPQLSERLVTRAGVLHRLEHAPVGAAHLHRRQRAVGTKLDGDADRDRAPDHRAVARAGDHRREPAPERVVPRRHDPHAKLGVVERERGLAGLAGGDAYVAERAPGGDDRRADDRQHVGVGDRSGDRDVLGRRLGHPERDHARPPRLRDGHVGQVLDVPDGGLGLGAGGGRRRHQDQGQDPDQRPLNVGDVTHPGSSRGAS